MDATGVTPDLCAREIMETVPRVMRFIRTEMRRQGMAHLSIPQLRVLMFLNRRPGAALLDVAEHLGVTPPTASTLVQRLVQRGLVDRSPHPHERRRVVLRLTPQGSGLLAEARQAAQARLAEALAALPPGDLSRLREGVALLGQAFKEVPDLDAR